MRTVVGLFDNLTEAQRTIQELVQLGFAAETISIATNLGAQRAIETGTHIDLSPMDVSDVGRIATGGPLREALRSQSSPGSSLDLASLLRRSGLSNELATRYAAGIKQGETLESIMVNDRDADNVAAVMRKHSHVPHTMPTPASMSTTMPLSEGSEVAAPVPPIMSTKERLQAGVGGVKTSKENRRFEDDIDRTIPVIREEIQIGKREVQTGSVRVSVHVVERPSFGEISLREEHVEIERRSVDRPVRGDENPFREDTIELREYAEQPLVTKQARVVEEIVLHKSIREHMARVGDNVRVTEVQFERPFDPQSYRQHFDALGTKGERFEEYAPAYKLGQDLRNDSRLHGSRWEDIEPRIREQWETKSPGTWEKFKESIRHAFGKS
jgi:uncharacterized protein (TIGR02271 family)